MSEHEDFERIARLISSLDDSVAPADADRKAAARTEFLMQAARLRIQRGRAALAPSRTRPPLLRFAAAGFGALVLTVGSATGVAYASNTAVPGDPLYGLDRAIENLQLSLSPNADSTIELLLAIADERLSESEVLSAQNDAPGLLLALDGYTLAVGRLEELLSGLPAGQSEQVTNELALHEQRLETILATAPEAALPGLTLALEAAQSAQDKAGNGAPPQETPGQGPPADTPGQGPPEDNPGHGPLDDPGQGPPEDNPGQGPPEDNPGQGPPDNRGPSNKPEKDKDNKKK
jgi:hypothetical protein